MLHSPRVRVLPAALGVIAYAVVSATPQSRTMDDPFAAFWSAPTAAAAAELVQTVAKSGITFEDAYRRLSEGRAYGPQPTGVVRLTNRTAPGVDHNFILNVPESYDPARRYQVRIHLHGGVMGRADNRTVGAGTIGALAGAEQIYVIPYAWSASPWWSDDEVLELHDIVDAVRRRYNVDENRVVLSGVSDGGTGAYYVAMRDTTPFAAFLPLNGFLMVLANHDLQIDGPLFPNNLRNKPFFAVNGGRDPLYPTSIVDPYVAHLRSGGVSIDYHPQPDAGHNTQWWPQVKDVFEQFVLEHPRSPLPDTLTWETASGTADPGVLGAAAAPGWSRAHWLVIDRLGAQKNDADANALPDLNEEHRPPAPEFGARTNGMHVFRVAPGSNAERIGLKPGDGVLRLNDESVGGYEDLDEALKNLKPGADITLFVARDNLPVELRGRYEPQMAMPPPRQLFDRGGPSGRVDLVRRGNTVEATTRGVAAFTLLLSPGQFDFARPVKVVVNGRTIIERRVTKDLRTLLKWAAADNDRTMLFAAELAIHLVR